MGRYGIEKLSSGQNYVIVASVIQLVENQVGYMTPEEEARKDIDELLKKAGWVLQDYKQLSLGAGIGVAVRNFPLKTGFADYMLFIDRKAVWAVEAKPKGTTLGGVSVQTEKYLHGLPSSIPHVGDPLPFGYESTGSETF